MSTRTTLIVVLFCLLAAALAGVLLWKDLPDPMASHWGLNDQANGTLPKFWAVFLIPLMGLGLLGLFLLIPLVDPLKANIAKFRPAYNAFIAALIVFLVYVHALTLAWNLGDHQLRMGQALLPALGVLYILIGLLLRQVRRNFFIGIRTPWTLSSDKVWDATHRLGSMLFIACGVVGLGGALLGGTLATLLMIVPVLTSGLALVLYSYLLYRDETKA